MMNHGLDVHTRLLLMDAFFVTDAWITKTTKWDRERDANAVLGMTDALWRALARY